MRKADVHEALAALYLRLNGYFTTGLILHSPQWGQNQTDIDCLAIRHPHHSQAERDLGTAKFLDDDHAAADVTDLILCEVKSDPNQLRFNKPIRTDPEALRAILRWAGIFNDKMIECVVHQLQPLLQEDVVAKTAQAGVLESGVRVRALLCCPAILYPVDGRWFLTGDEIFEYAGRCFNPAEPRASCSTRYNFGQWGYPFTPIVQWFKERPDRLALEVLYERLGAE
jgi:hypothetical protein